MVVTLTSGVKLISDFLKTPNPAGLLLIAEISPPSAAKAPPMAAERAVPKFGWLLNLTISSKFCAFVVRVTLTTAINIAIFFIELSFILFYLLVGLAGVAGRAVPPPDELLLGV